MSNRYLQHVFLFCASIATTQRIVEQIIYWCAKQNAQFARSGITKHEYLLRTIFFIIAFCTAHAGLIYVTLKSIEKRNIFKSLTMRKHAFARRIFGRAHVALPRFICLYLSLSIIPKYLIYTKEIYGDEYNYVGEGLRTIPRINNIVHHLGATNRRAITDAPMHRNLTRTGGVGFVLPIHSLVELRSYE